MNMRGAPSFRLIRTELRQYTELFYVPADATDSQYLLYLCLWGYRSRTANFHAAAVSDVLLMHMPCWIGVTGILSRRLMYAL